MGNSNSGGEDDVDAKGKYFLIAVPQFAKDPITGNLMTSYLRLGASSSTWEADPGGWLAAMIHLYGPPGNHLSPTGVEVDTNSEERLPENVFSDDERHRIEGTGHLLSTAERQAQSSIIHTRGGWRDHSDGNRISTTYGDKIEIVRGNYKLMVLGRQDDPEQSVGLDGSSLLMESYGNESSGVRIEESSIYKDEEGNNVWHFQDSSEGVVLSENFAGDHYEFSWGKKFYSTTGSEAPAEKGPHGYTRENPHILEKTWAQKIESYTGSPGWPIPTITEETWAIATAELTNVAVSIDEKTICPGIITSSTDAGIIDEKTTATSMKDKTTVTTSITSETNAATTSETNIIGAVAEVNVLGASAVVSTVGVGTEVTIQGAKADVLVVGAYADVKVAAIHAELEVALIHAKLEIAACADIFIGAKMEIKLGAFLEIEGGTKKEIGMDETNLFLENTWIVAKYCVTAPLVKLGIL